MEVIIFLLAPLLVVTAARGNFQHERDRASIAEQIREALESVREVMLDGAPAQGVPVLDPLLLELFHFQLDEVGAEGILNASGVVVEDLSTFVVNDVQFSVLSRRLTFDVTAPELFISAEYFDVDGSADDQEIKAIGNGTLVLCEPQVSGSLRVKVTWSGDILMIYDVRLKFSMRSMKSHLNVKEDDGINEVLEELVPSFVKSHQAFAVETLGVWSPDARTLGNDLGKLLIDKSGDRRAKSFFFQRIGLAIQSGNAASVLGAVGESAELVEIFQPERDFGFPEPGSRTDCE